MLHRLRRALRLHALLRTAPGGVAGRRPGRASPRIGYAGSRSCTHPWPSPICPGCPAWSTSSGTESRRGTASRRYRPCPTLSSFSSAARIYSRSGRGRCSASSSCAAGTICGPAARAPVSLPVCCSRRGLWDRSSFLTRSRKSLPGYSPTRTSWFRFPPVYLLVARAVTRAFSGRAAGVFQGTVAVGLGAASLAYLLFSMDYYTTPTKEQVREAVAYVASHEDRGTLVVRCDADDRLDYYLNAGGRQGAGLHGQGHPESREESQRGQLQRGIPSDLPAPSPTSR